METRGEQPDEKQVSNNAGAPRNRRYARGERISGTNYCVIDLIGRGGMGAVYEVEHVELGRRFVLKALHHRLADRDDLVARMNNEWRVLGRLNHPNIVQVTDAGRTDSGLPFFVMERLRGATLSELLKRKQRLTGHEALDVAADVLAALTAAHGQETIHRDIKPQNIFVSDDGTTKLLDFGIAKLRAKATKVVTANGVAIGTPRFMAPEQASGSRVDARADIYALALVLFEAVVGRGPFADIRDPNELVLAQIAEMPPRADEVRADVDPALADLIQRWLSKDPAGRPKSADLARQEVLALKTSLQPSTSTLAEVTWAGTYDATTAGATDSLSDDERTLAQTSESAPQREPPKAHGGSSVRPSSQGYQPPPPPAMRVHDALPGRGRGWPEHRLDGSVPSSPSASSEPPRERKGPASSVPPAIGPIRRLPPSLRRHVLAAIVFGAAVSSFLVGLIGISAYHRAQQWFQSRQESVAAGFVGATAGRRFLSRGEHSQDAASGRTHGNPSMAAPHAAETPSGPSSSSSPSPLPAAAAPTPAGQTGQEVQSQRHRDESRPESQRSETLRPESLRPESRRTESRRTEDLHADDKKHPADSPRHQAERARSPVSPTLSPGSGLW